MAKHHPDLIMCMKQPGIAIGRLCEKCDGKCPICDSYVRPATQYGCVMSATTDHMKGGVSSVEGLAFRTHTTAKNAPCKKKTEMGARRLLTSAVRKQIFSTSAKSTATGGDSRPAWVLSSTAQCCCMVSPVHRAPAVPHGSRNALEQQQYPQVQQVLHRCCTAVNWFSGPVGPVAKMSPST
eukprot:CAMPEP_0202903728 /NCGR_PEP_ID=MMETSP1392-20130828/26000_1 /ASSEMBLY_ACC=CAM_ASM_000868 /TAXON_ID=225041 /ORGANISM="Chlamydomonas chlamydogama, Strain SAG 11-48b" /LENGTH=180 /DNA_ID=CAMNT_0049591043 /DNA_START=173 /DNA_END=716 /DNA_ORIENTATION=-